MSVFASECARASRTRRSPLPPVQPCAHFSFCRARGSSVVPRGVGRRPGGAVVAGASERSRRSFECLGFFCSGFPLSLGYPRPPLTALCCSLPLLPLPSPSCSGSDSLRARRSSERLPGFKLLDSGIVCECLRACRSARCCPLQPVNLKCPALSRSREPRTIALPRSEPSSIHEASYSECLPGFFSFFFFAGSGRWLFVSAGVPRVCVHRSVLRLRLAAGEALEECRWLRDIELGT